MPLHNRILDNQAATVADHLKHNLRHADAFNLASAYFTIYGYQLLADDLEKVEGVRFLFGDPNSVEDLDPSANEPKSFELTEQGLEPNHTLQQKALAKRCANWVAKDAVAIRSISRANFLHGKMYLTDSSDGATRPIRKLPTSQTWVGQRPGPTWKSSSLRTTETRWPVAGIVKGRGGTPSGLPRT